MREYGLVLGYNVNGQQIRGYTVEEVKKFANNALKDYLKTANKTIYVNINKEVAW